MPPTPSEETFPCTSSERPSKHKDVLHSRFSTAAAALTGLYRESTDAYEAGYRDALLYIHRYVLLTSVKPPRRATTDPGAPVGAAPVPVEGTREDVDALPFSCAPVMSPDSTVVSDKLLKFIHNTLHRRKERIAVARGTHERLRRPRSVDEDEVDRLAECGGTTDSDTESEYETSAVTPLVSEATSTHVTMSMVGTGHSMNRETVLPESECSEARDYSSPPEQRCEVEGVAEPSSDTAAERERPPRQLRRCFTPVAANRYS